MTEPKKKRGRPKKRDTSGWTPVVPFRLSEETLAEIDWLSRRLGLTARADVVRQAVRKLALAEGYPAAEK